MYNSRKDNNGLSILELSDERIQAHRDYLISAHRFETPKRLPMSYFYVQRNGGNTDHFTPNEVMTNDYRNYTKNPDFDYFKRSYNEKIDEWNELGQKFPTLDINAFLLMLSPQEVMPTAFGLPYEIDDNGDLHIDWMKNRIMDSCVDWDNPKLNKHPDYKKDGLFGLIWKRYEFWKEHADPRIHFRYPTFLGPFLIAGKILGTEEAFMAYVDSPDEMNKFMEWLSDECIRMMQEVADFMGPEKVHGHFHFEKGTAYVWDDMISMTGEDWYLENVALHTEKVLKAFGGGAFHTCGPLKPDFFRAIKGMPSVNAINFAFVNPDQTHTAESILEMKNEFHGKALLNCPPPHDLSEFTPKFARELMKDGGVSLYECGDDERCEQLVDVLDKAEALI